MHVGPAAVGRGLVVRENGITLHTGLLVCEAFQVGVPCFLPRHARLCGWVAVVRDLLQHGGEDVDLRAPVGRVRPDGRGGMLIEGWQSGLGADCSLIRGFLACASTVSPDLTPECAR